MGGGQPLPVFFCFLLARRATRVEWGRLLSCFFYSIRWAVVASPCFFLFVGKTGHERGLGPPALLCLVQHLAGDGDHPALCVPFLPSYMSHSKGGAAYSPALPFFFEAEDGWVLAISPFPALFVSFSFWQNEP